MNQYSKKNLTIAGVAATMALAVSLPVVALSAQHERNGDMYVSTSTLRAFDQVKASSEIIGMNVQSISGNRFGQVDDIFVDMKTGKVLAIVTSASPRLNERGGSPYLLSNLDYHFDKDKNHLVTELSEGQFLAAPRYRKLDMSGIDRVRSQATNRTPGNQRNVTVVDDRIGSQLMAISDLLAMDVQNMAGDKVGSVDEVYLDIENGTVIGVVVSTGGFLGMGAHQNILALHEFQFNGNEDNLRVNQNRDQLRSAPVYMKADSSWLAALLERSKWMQSNAANQPRPVDTESMTAFSQGTSRAETRMTADIRKTIADHATLSSRAKSVTVISQQNRVHLQGEVDSPLEKTTVEGIARAQAGVRTVTSELTVRLR
jgi:sporulation protein YlmC with PRC-barrel domain